MKRRLPIGPFLSLLLIFSVSLLAAEEIKKRLKYPAAPKGDQVDDYHGRHVPDPYRGLEDPESPQSRKWIEEQNKLTSSFFQRIPERKQISQRLTRLWDYEKSGVPWREGGRYFLFKNSGLQNQDVLYSASELAGEMRVLLDPNTLSPDGTIALTSSVVSDDGKLLAYGLSEAGSDWEEWRVRDIDSGKDLEDRLRWIKFGAASWTADGSGFFYSRYDEPTDDPLKATNRRRYRTAGPRNRERLRRQAILHGNVLLLRQLHGAADNFPARSANREKHNRGAAKGGFQLG